MSRKRRQVELANSYVEGIPKGFDLLPPGYSGPLSTLGGGYDVSSLMAEQMSILVSEAPFVMKDANDIAQSEYLGKFSRMEQDIEADVQTVNQAIGDTPVSTIEALKRGIVARSILIERKQSDLNFQQGVANHFFGSTPLGKRPLDYVSAVQRLELSGEEGAFGFGDALIDSFRGAYRVQLREAEIQLLQGQIAALHQAIAHAEAQAQAHAEALRIAHAEALARAHAEAQARAHEEALKRAHEQALARAHSIAQAQAKAREAAAKAEVERALAEKAIREANTYSVPLTGLAVNPAVVMAIGAAPMLDAGLALGTAIRAAVASLGAASVEAVAGQLLVGTFALLYSPKLGNGELQDNFILSTPLTDLNVELDAAA